jgi:hypothetical protein
MSALDDGTNHAFNLDPLAVFDAGVYAKEAYPVRV